MGLPVALVVAVEELEFVCACETSSQQQRTTRAMALIKTIDFMLMGVWLSLEYALMDAVGALK